MRVGAPYPCVKRPPAHLVLALVSGLLIGGGGTASGQRPVSSLPSPQDTIARYERLAEAGWPAPAASATAVRQAGGDTPLGPTATGRSGYFVQPAAHRSPGQTAAPSPGEEMFDELPSTAFTRPPRRPPGLSRQKDGLLQRAELSTTWLAGGDGRSDFGMFDLETYVTVGLPAPTRDSPLLISPGFGAHFLDGPAAFETPARVHEAYLSVTWMPRLNDRWSAIVNVSPGVYSDFQSVDSDAIRITGRGLLRYQWVPGEWELLMGIVYLDRDDVSLLPAAGLIWTPDANQRLELVFPRPKWAWRLQADSTSELWWHVGGEFGGGTWQVQRPSGTNDHLTISDLRALIGLERKVDGGGGWKLELGYVFARSLEYSSSPVQFDPQDTVLLRFVTAY